MDKKMIARFWDKVDKRRECWEWTGRRNSNGYGRVSFRNPIGDSADLLAHRVAWFLAHGPVPEGLSVCHTCDNPGCVNPAHLFTGTQAENVADMRRKGRGVAPPHHYGTKNPAAKLNPAKVRYIRKNAGKRPAWYFAQMFGVSRVAVNNVIKRKVWKQVG